MNERIIVAACWLAIACGAGVAGQGSQLRTDTVPPLFSSDPAAMMVREESFMLRLALNEAGTAYYTVIRAGSEPPSSFQVRWGLVDDQVVGGSIVAPVADQTVSADVVDLPAQQARQLEVYLVAEDLAGNLVAEPRKIAVDLADYTEPSFPKGYPKVVAVGTGFVSVELGLDEPGYVYYLMQQSKPGEETSEDISPADIKACAKNASTCAVPNTTSAGSVEIGGPVPGLPQPYDGGYLYRNYQVPYKPGHYWLHFAAEDDEQQPNLMTKRNIVRRMLASVQPPTWSDEGDDPYYVPSLADASDPTKGYFTYVDPGIRATNPTAAVDITDDVITTHNVDTSRPGEYTVTYTVTYLDTTTISYVTATETRTVIVTGPWAPLYKGYMNGINQDEGNNPGSCCEWYRTCRLEDYMWDCTQDVIDSCSSSDTSAKCVICLQLDEYVEAGWGYSKYVHEKPTISDYGKDAAFVGYVRPDEMERQRAMGNLPGLMGPKNPAYLGSPVHRLEKASGKPQRSETKDALAAAFNWRDGLDSGRLDLIKNHNVGRRMLADAIYLHGYLKPSNVRGRNYPLKVGMIKGKTGTYVAPPKFSVCGTVRYQCTAFRDAGSGKCLPQGGGQLHASDYARNYGSFVKNEVRSNMLQQHLDDKKRHTDPVWQRR